MSDRQTMAAGDWRKGFGKIQINPPHLSLVSYSLPVDMNFSFVNTFKNSIEYVS